MGMSALATARRRINQLVSENNAMIPAKEWVTHYGTGVIKVHSKKLDNYVVLTSPSAWIRVITVQRVGTV